MLPPGTRGPYKEPQLHPRGGPKYVSSSSWLVDFLLFKNVVIGDKGIVIVERTLYLQNKCSKRELLNHHSLSLKININMEGIL